MPKVQNRTVIYTQKSLADFFASMGIRKGDVVLLQADLHGADIIGGYGALIDSILDLIGNSGLLVVPAFSFHTLDPRSTDNGYPLQEYDTIRKGTPGFSSKMTVPDRYYECAAALMLHIKTRRSEHPVFSFAWLGACPYKPAITDMHFPLSYKHILKVMDDPGAVNLIIGESLNTAIYPILEARRNHKDTVRVMEAYYRKVKRSFPTLFLSSEIDERSFNEVLKKFTISQYELDGLPVYKIVLK